MRRIICMGIAFIALLIYCSRPIDIVLQITCILTGPVAFRPRLGGPDCFRHLLSAPGRLAPAAVITVSAAALIVGTGLATGRLPALAQTSVAVAFHDGNAIERLVKENTPTGGSVGAPIVATGVDGQLTYSLSGADCGLVHYSRGNRPDPRRARYFTRLRV